MVPPLPQGIDSLSIGDHGLIYGWSPGVTSIEASCVRLFLFTLLWQLSRP
eukprot:COSAG02_NODE_48201_length_335_cov_1.038136_1_plen_49_part_01